MTLEISKLTYKKEKYIEVVIQGMNFYTVLPPHQEDVGKLKIEMGSTVGTYDVSDCYSSIEKELYKLIMSEMVDNPFILNEFGHDYVLKDAAGYFYIDDYEKGCNYGMVFKDPLGPGGYNTLSTDSNGPPDGLVLEMLERVNEILFSHVNRIRKKDPWKDF